MLFLALFIVGGMGQYGQGPIMLAAHVLVVPVEAIEVKDGVFRVRDAHLSSSRANRTSCDMRELARLALSPNLPKEFSPGLEAGASVRLDAQTYAYTTHVAQVEVDICSGAVKVLKYFVVQDAGRLINRSIVLGQIHGAVAHGLGNALLERMRYDEDAQPLTITLGDYHIPVAATTPEFLIELTQTPSPLNELGAKGVGELATLPVAAAIASAIEDALEGSGLSISEAPVSHETVFRAAATFKMTHCSL